MAARSDGVVARTWAGGMAEDPVGSREWGWGRRVGRCWEVSSALWSVSQMVSYLLFQLRSSVAV